MNMKTKLKVQNATKNKFELLLAILLLAFNSQAQRSENIIFINDTSTSLATSFYNYYRANQHIDSACITTNTFIKIRLDSNYKINEFVYNFQTDPKTKTLLNPFFQELGQWHIKDKQLAKIILGKEIILPVILNLFNSSCKTKSGNYIDVAELLNFDQTIHKEPYPYFMGSGNSPFFYGIILKPLILFSPYN